MGVPILGNESPHVGRRTIASKRYFDPPLARQKNAPNLAVRMDWPPAFGGYEEALPTAAGFSVEPALDERVADSCGKWDANYGRYEQRGPQ